jgi:hypothetical protein
MKTKYLLPVLCTAVLLSFNLNARADGGDCGQTNECNINGNEVMDAIVTLTATSNAPAGATGFAIIDSDNEDDCESATLKVRTFGLDPGDYILSITLQSTGTNIILAGFTAAPSSCGGGDDGDDNEDGDNGDQNEDNNSQNSSWMWGGGGDGGEDGGGCGCNPLISCDWGGFTNWGAWTNWCDTNQVTETKTEVDLPAGVNPTDISEIDVSDTNGNLILFGDLTNPAPSTVINISATVQVMPGSAAPSATGTAHIHSTAVRGKWKHQFNLVASGVSTSSTYKLNVNGKTSGATKSNKQGQTTIKKLPSHTSALRSIRLLDKQGNEAAAAHF